MAIGGIIPKKVTVIGGRSGSGKTALTTPLFEASLRRKVDGSRLEYLFFTWELDPSIVIDRGVCANAGVTIRQLNQGAKLLSETTIDRIKAAYATAVKYPISYHIYSTDISEVLAVSREFVARCAEKSKIEQAHVQPVVCIDYLNMAQFDAEGIRTYGIADFMNRIKGFCNETSAAFIIFTQLKREVDKSGKWPDRSDLADSAAIENAADNLVLIHRPEYHNIYEILDPDTGVEVDARNKMLMRILKCRDYGVGDMLINCDIRYFRFWDKFQRYDHKYWLEYGTKEFWMKEFNLTSLEQKESELNLLHHV